MNYYSAFERLSDRSYRLECHLLYVAAVLSVVLADYAH